MASKKTYACNFCGHVSKRSDAHERHLASCSSKPALAPVVLPTEPSVIEQVMERTIPCSIDINVGDKMYDMMLAAAGMVQHRYNSTFKGLDARIERRREPYVEILSALADKYGIRLDLAPEYALALNVSQDVAASIIARMLMPIADAKGEAKQSAAVLGNVLQRMDVEWD